MFGRLPCPQAVIGVIAATRITKNTVLIFLFIMYIQNKGRVLFTLLSYRFAMKLATVRPANVLTDEKDPDHLRKPIGLHLYSRWKLANFRWNAHVTYASGNAKPDLTTNHHRKCLHIRWHYPYEVQSKDVASNGRAASARPRERFRFGMFDRGPAAIVFFLFRFLRAQRLAPIRATASPCSMS